tara:strand:+ start:412 stop:555 length:144 start_codon:yes stop_codon:yes gene_type:complete
MKINPKSKLEEKIRNGGLEPTDVLMRKLAILMVFVGVYFFFIKILFL